MNAADDARALATVEWGVATRAIATELVSGDQHAVVRYQHQLMLAVVDGLGHGAYAHAAAMTAISTLEHHVGLPLPDLMQRCHRQLVATRGVVMSVASIDLAADVLTWIGVGNVEGCLIRPQAAGPDSRQMLVQRGGIVGFNLPSLRPASVKIADGDLLILATDGIGSSHHRAIHGAASPSDIAARILAEHARETDDALVLVARYHRTPT